MKFSQQLLLASLASCAIAYPLQAGHQHHHHHQKREAEAEVVVVLNTSKLTNTDRSSTKTLLPLLQPPYPQF